MTRRYTYETTLAFGGEVDSTDYVELDVRVTHTMAWGSPESGAGYMADPALYDPGSPDVVEDVLVVAVDGKPRPWNQLGMPDDELARTIEKLLEAAHEDMALAAGMREQAEKEDAEESRWEERREEMRRS